MSRARITRILMMLFVIMLTTVLAGAAQKKNNPPPAPKPAPAAKPAPAPRQAQPAAAPSAAGPAPPTPNTARHTGPDQPAIFGTNSVTPEHADQCDDSPNARTNTVNPNVRTESQSQLSDQFLEPQRATSGRPSHPNRSDPKWRTPGG